MDGFIKFGIGIAVTLSTLFTFTLCDKQILAVELTIPDLFSSVSAMEKAITTLRHGKKNTPKVLTGQMIATKLLSKIKTITALAKLLPRRTMKMPRPWPRVQIDKGVPKSEKVKYPKDYFANRLKILIKLQEKENARNRNMNRDI